MTGWRVGGKGKRRGREEAKEDNNRKTGTSFYRPCARLSKSLCGHKDTPGDVGARGWR